MNNDDIARLVLKLLEEYAAFFQGSTSGGNAGSIIRVTLNGTVINAQALTNCSPGNVSIIKDKNNKYYALSENVNNLVLNRYVRYRQRRDRPRTYSADVTNTVYNAPILFSKNDIKIPVLYKRTKSEYGDAGILFHTVQSYSGPHPDELCPCSRWMPTANACVRTCAGTGEFDTQQGCDDYRGNRTGGFLKLYHTSGTYGSLNDGLPYFPYKLNTAGLVQLPYQTRAEGNMYIIKSKAGGIDMDKYDFTTQRFYTLDESNNRTYYEWYELNIYFVGVQYVYFKIANNTIVESYKTITQIGDFSSSYPGLGFDSITPTQPYTITGKVWQRGWGYHYFKTRLKVTDPPIPPYRPPSDPSWDEQVPNWSPVWGNITGWAEELIPSNPPPLPSNPPRIEDPITNRYMTIKYYLGGHTPNPIFLGEYLSYYNSEIDPSNSTLGQKGKTDCYEGELVSPSFVTGLGTLSEAYVVAIGEKEYEVVIKYGTFAKSQDYYPPSSGSSARVTSFYWCKIDVFHIKNSSVNKTTYSYPSDITLSSNNWMKLFLSNWIKYEYKQPLVFPFTPDPRSDFNESSDIIFFNANTLFYFNLPVALGFTNKEHCAYLVRLLEKNRSVAGRINKYVINQSSNYQRLKVLGAEAGRVSLKKEGVSDFNLNFVIDNNNPQESYALDCDGNQWIGDGLFIDEIKTKTLTNVPIKVGKVKAEWYTYESFYCTPPEFGVINNTNFNPIMFQSGGTVYLTKVFSLNNANCAIKQIVSWKSTEDIDTVTRPFYSYLIKTPFTTFDAFLEENIVLGIYTYNTNSIKLLIPSFNPTTKGENYFFHTDLLLGKPEYRIYGWLYAGSILVNSNNANQGNTLYPIILKDCSNNPIVTLSSTTSVNTNAASLPFPYPGITPQERITMEQKGCVVKGLCEG